MLWALRYSNIFPGFMMPWGSKSSLICLINLRLSPCSFFINFLFPIPTPCSPVAVPLHSNAKLTISSAASWTFCYWDFSSGIPKISIWRLPLPAWPKANPFNPFFSMVFCPHSTISEYFEMGIAVSITRG